MPETSTLEASSAVLTLRQVQAAGRAAAERVRSVLQGDALPAATLIAALVREPDFAVADPWALAGSTSAALGHATQNEPGATPTKRASRPTDLAASRRPVKQGSASEPLEADSLRRGAEAALPAALAAAPLAARIANPSNRWLAWRDLPQGAATAAVSAATPEATAASALSRLMAAHPPSFDELLAQRAWDGLQGDAPDTRQHEAFARSIQRALAAAQTPIDPTDPHPNTEAGRVVRAVLERVLPRAAARPTEAIFVPAADLLKGFVDALSGGRTESEARPPASAARATVAPRAASRLLGEVAPAVSNRVADAAAPSAPSGAARAAAFKQAAPSAEADEAVADALNRLLVDQAWLRGVDFT